MVGSSTLGSTVRAADEHLKLFFCLGGVNKLPDRVSGKLLKDRKLERWSRNARGERMLWVRVFREGMTEMEGEGGMRDGCSG